MSLAPFIIVGCGGSGVLSVRHIRDEVRDRLKARGVESLPKAWQFIGIDLVSAQTDLNEASPLPQSDYLPMRPGAKTLDDLDKVLFASHPIADPALGYDELIGWRPSPKDLPGSFETGAGQNRAVGRVVGAASLSHPSIDRRIREAVDACAAGGAELNALAQRIGGSVGGLNAPPAMVLVISSSAGGTGAGIAQDVVELIKRIGGPGVEPMLVAYGSDIFGAQSASGMAANGLTFMSELLNACWSENGGKTGLFRTPGIMPSRRGPRASFVIGRKNFKGIDLSDSRSVYKAVGISIAGWMMSSNVRQRVQDYVLSNWDVTPLYGGYGFADSSIPGKVSSFGSATISIGRKRFRDYARKYLLRSLYAHHSQGFRAVARANFGESGENGTELAIKGRIVERFMPEVLQRYGLANSFDSEGGIIDDGTAQISDALLSRSHLQGLANEIETTLLTRLPAESIRGSEWSGLIEDELDAIKTPTLRAAIEEYHRREEEWLNDLVRRVVVESNSYLNTLTLPVMIDVCAAVIDSVQRAGSGFKMSAQAASVKRDLFRQEYMNGLADVSSNKLTKESAQISEAISQLAASIGQDFKAQASELVSRTLEQVVINLLQPLRAAFSRASDDVSALTESQFNEPAVISSWPEREIVPKSFIPSQIEHLIEEHDEWPLTLERLLRSAEEVVSGEDHLTAARRGISQGETAPGEIGSTKIRPLLWTRNDAELRFAKTGPLPLEVGLNLESLEDRVDRWLMRPDRPMGRYFREGLKEYLADPMHPDHNRRMQRFKQKFQTALEQSSPLVEIDTTYFATAYPNQTINLQYTVEPLPFQSGHSAYSTAEELLRNALGLGANDPVGLFFADTEVESVTVSCFFSKPMFLGMVSSIMEDIAQRGVATRSFPVQFRSWLDFKRARTLDEFIPLPENLVRALIRGYLVGRMIGAIKVEQNAPVEISTKAGALQFPHPSFAEMSSELALTSVLMSFPLCFIEVSQKREKAFEAYAQLFALGVDNPQLVTPAQFRVAGPLEAFIKTGNSGIPVIQSKLNSERMNGTPEDRIGEMVDYLERNRRYFESLIQREFDGNEHARQGMKWDREEIPARELAPLVVKEFDLLVNALSRVLSTQNPDTPDL